MDSLFEFVGSLFSGDREDDSSALYNQSWGSDYWDDQIASIINKKGKRRNASFLLLFLRDPDALCVAGFKKIFFPAVKKLVSVAFGAIDHFKERCQRAIYSSIILESMTNRI